MFTTTEIYNIVLAEKLELEWDGQHNLQDAYETFTSLPVSKQTEFEKLVKRAVTQCQSDFDAFPEQCLDSEDLLLREEVIHNIIEKLEPIFEDFLQ